MQGCDTFTAELKMADWVEILTVFHAKLCCSAPKISEDYTEGSVDVGARTLTRWVGGRMAGRVGGFFEFVCVSGRVGVGMCECQCAGGCIGGWVGG